MEPCGKQITRSTELSKIQDQRLLISLRHIDKLLAEVEGILQSSESGAVFPQYVDDLTYAESRTIEGYARQLRQKLVDVVRWQGLSLPVPDIPARRAVSVRVAFIEIAIEEMKPKYLRGSGVVSSVAEEFLYGISGELQEIASRMNAYITGSMADSLSVQAHVLGDSEPAQRLNCLAEIVSRHQMVQFRPALQVLVNGFKNGSYEIAAFGRVSSGKSSLLNALLGTSRLPVGTTPVTAVPTRIEYAEEALLEVRFLGGRSAFVGAEDLSAFASEEQNPKNTKGVVRLALRLPLEALRAGLTFVDTPGIGSLAKSGAKEAKAYLPAADLALVLIDAGGTLVDEDLDLLRLLDDAGIRSIVLLSKADLLTEEDLHKACSYTADQLKQNIRSPTPVIAMSSFAAWNRQRRQFYSEYLSPLAKKTREHRAASLHLKMLLLASRILLALENYPSSLADPGKLPNADQEERRRAIQARLQMFESHCSEELDLLRTAAIPFLGDVSDRITSQLVEHGRRTVTSSEVQTLIASAVQSRVEPLIGQATDIAVQIDQLTRHPEVSAASTEAYQAIRGAPLFEEPTVPGSFAAGQFLPEWLLRRRLATFTKGVYEEQLRADLIVYADRLASWFRVCLSRLRETLLTVQDQSTRAGHPSRPGPEGARIAEDVSALQMLLNSAQKTHCKIGGTES